MRNTKQDSFAGQAKKRLDKQASRKRSMWYGFAIAFLIFCYYVLKLAGGGSITPTQTKKEAAAFLFTELAIDKSGKAVISESTETTTNSGMKHGITRLLGVRMHGYQKPEAKQGDEEKKKEDEGFKLRFSLIDRNISFDGVELGALEHPDPIPFGEDSLVLLGDPKHELDPGKYRFEMSYSIDNFVDALRQPGGFYWDLGRVFSFSVGIYKARILLPPFADPESFSVEMFLGSYDPQTGLVGDGLETVKGELIRWESSDDAFYKAQKVNQVVFTLPRGIEEGKTVLIRIRDLAGFLSMKVSATPAQH